MAPCCTNTVTPRMIKAGQVSVGDKIQFEDASAAPQEAKPAENKELRPDDILVFSQVEEQKQTKEKKQADIPVVTPNGENFQGITGTPGGSFQGITGIPGGVKLNPVPSAPMPYSRMTSYLDNVAMGGTQAAPSIITPRAPMTPDGFEEEIDYESVRAFDGFLRTQIGRYMRIEQLIGSNLVENRFGFLVGVGTNFIILQEITTGNIMVLDIFSIRLTYIYYSPPVIPEF